MTNGQAAKAFISKPGVNWVSPRAVAASDCIAERHRLGRIATAHPVAVLDDTEYRNRQSNRRARRHDRER